MKKEITHKEYAKALLRLEELINVVDDEMDLDNALAVELNSVSDVIEVYEQTHFPIGLPTLNEVIRLRMFEMQLKQKDLAKILNTSASRVSDYLNGKREITLDVAKSLHQKLNIDSDIILQ